MTSAVEKFSTATRANNGEMKKITLKKPVTLSSLLGARFTMYAANSITANLVSSEG